MRTDADTTRKPIAPGILAEIESGRLESLEAHEILIWGVKNFHPRLSLATSFGGQEGMVLLDMLHRIEPESRVFLLDTGRLPQATYDLVDRVRDRYGKNIEVLFPRAESVQEMVRERGLNLFYASLEDRQRCCQVRKVEPLNRALSELDAWVSALRRDQGVTREKIRKVEIDTAHGGIVKLNPLADWSFAQVEQYVSAHGVPVNRLHREGYPTVGCAPCSRAIRPGEDPRAGRWWWENPETRECGIHPGQEEGGSGI
ncbi:MAG: phosphoadenylyl-sulfate reductase [Deltaproteobacteria bacterium]|nr:MAG: phosphoadenylyl-sulfate reductase [Deltaproteobacteria bacterium]